jgi:uncharacterized membrane protein YsdA (DUF1294 family)
MKYIGIAYLIVLIVMSFITFAFYGWDKRQARLDRQRTPEARLHLLALLGGWPGAVCGRKFFRHKTHKARFAISTWIIIAVHIAVTVAVCYFCF